VVLDSYVRHPFSLSVFEDTIYWSDWSRKEIKSCNKFNGKNRKVLVKTKGHLPMGIHVHHPINQGPVSYSLYSNFLRMFNSKLDFGDEFS
jgi:hypothetical protein